MKKYFLPLVLLGALLVGCKQNTSNSSSTTQQAKDSISPLVLDWSKFDLSGMDLNLGSVVLFEAGNQTELEQRLPGALSTLNTEIEEIKKQDARIDLVLYKLTFENKKATISEIEFIDTKNKTIVTIGDTKAMSIPPAKWTEIDEFLNGKCPNGWTEGGTASSESGVAAITKQILLPHITRVRLIKQS